MVALAWAVLPAMPALVAGMLVGSRFTDLYPSAWGMQVMAEAWPLVPLSTDRLGAPGSVGFYYSSPIHGWLGAPLTLAAGPALAYNLTLLAARWATVFCTFGWLRAEGRGTTAALAGSLLYGASPFFHGYAAEGIVEGTDGWTLPLWAWSVARNRPMAAIGAFALCVVSSWYLGMVACGVAVLLGFQRRLAWTSLAGGILLAAPAFYGFASAFGGNTALPEAVRLAMSAKLAIAAPHWSSPPNPFAINTFVGATAALLALPSVRKQPILALLAGACFLLSTGRGLWWELPLFSLVRFPYRWHAGTLFALAGLVALTVDALIAGAPTTGKRRWVSVAAGFVPWFEGLAFSPISPLLPGATTELPAIYREVRGPILLELPGPVALPPGAPNASRPRARFVLWAQATHGARSPWTLDFNGVSRDQDAPWLDSFASWDPLLHRPQLAPGVNAARAAGVRQILLHQDGYGDRADALEHALVAAGAVLTHSEPGHRLFAL